MKFIMTIEDLFPMKSGMGIIGKNAQITMDTVCRICQPKEIVFIKHETKIYSFQALDTALRCACFGGGRYPNICILLELSKDIDKICRGDFVFRSF